MKKVLILGFGVSGRSAAKLLLSQGAEVTAYDQNNFNDSEVIKLIEKGVLLLDDVADLNPYDLIVASPGVPPANPIYQKAKILGKEIIGEIELACRYCKAKMVGITGTNGKTTVTLLITHALNHFGKKASALGNVGVPFAEKVADLKEDEVAVLELSSFQIETMKEKVLEAGLILNITPDHLDRYSDMEAYAAAKIGLGRCLKAGYPLFAEETSYAQFRKIFNSTNCSLYGYSSDADIYTDLQYIYTKQERFLLPEILRGKKSHDLENFLAAYAISSYFGVPYEAFSQAYSTFRKPAHRIQFVSEIDGVSYYDDSKGTNIDAVSRAVESLSGNVILIAGGVDKGAAYTPWIKAFARKVSCIIAIGEAKEKIKQDLSESIPVILMPDLESAVRYAAKIAKQKESVLLSPGCSSYDMFRNYIHRGEEFQRIVKSLGV